MDPEKLAEFTQNKLIPDAAERFICQVVNVEMPNSLKRYLELKLFPWVTLKVGKGISLCTAQQWLHREGFKYTAHKKALYYDGHERADVIKFWQEVFLPLMVEYHGSLHTPTEYSVGNLPDPCIHRMNIWSAIHLTPAYTE